MYTIRIAASGLCTCCTILTLYLRLDSSAILGVVLVGMALVTSFVINQMDLFDEHIEVHRLSVLWSWLACSLYVLT